MNLFTIPSPSPREIREALTEILMQPRPDLVIKALSDAGILKKILPEVENMRGVEQPKQFHPEGDVFMHTMLMLTHIAWHTPRLGWSVLLHDIGKPAAQTYTPDGIPHFYGHESIGADMADALLQRLEMPPDDRSTIVTAVRNHMRFAHVERMRKTRLDRILREESFPLELELNRIDCISSNGMLESYVYLLDRMAQRAEEDRLAPPPCLLTGRDLICAGFPPGPRFSSLFAECIRLQKEKRLNSRSDALHWLDTLPKN